MTVEKNVVKRVLHLDSLVPFLEISDRINCHKFIMNKSQYLSHKVKEAMEFVITHQWRPPYCMYGQDRVLYYLVEDAKIPASLYVDPIQQLVITHLKK
ncbi:hypothetical protein ACYSNX_02840 [Myroides sp. LJL115]